MPIVLQPILFILSFWLVVGAICYVVLHPETITEHRIRLGRTLGEWLKVTDILKPWVDEPWEVAFYIALAVTVLLVGTLYLMQSVDLLVLVGGLASLIVGIIGMKAPHDSWMREIAPELIGISIGVIAIDQLYQIRTDQQEKQAIIRQIHSPSHEFAIEAVRLASEYGWLYDGSLEGANLQNTNLRGANLQNANLRGANLEAVNLQDAYLRDANLQDAYLFYANLHDTNLGTANLTGATLRAANLTGATLRAANLTGASLQNTDMTNANLQNANMTDANLEYAYLRGANLQNANLTGANLEATGLYEANLESADLTGADLGYAYLEGANLQNASLASARYTEETRWPDGFDPKASGAILVKWDNEVMRYIPVKDK